MNWLARFQPGRPRLATPAVVPAPRTGPPGWLQIFALVFILVAVARLLIIYRKFYFFADDFLNFIIAQDMGLTRRYLERDVFGQLIPLYRLGINVYYHVAGVHYWLFEAASITSCLLILAILYAQARTRRVTLAIVIPILAWAAFAPVFVDTDQWLAAALSIFPACVLGAAALWLSHDVDDRWTVERRFAVPVLYATGLLFYPKVLFLVILVMAIRAYDRLHRPASTTLARALVASCVDAVPLAILAAIYTSINLSMRLGSGAQEPTVSQLVEYVVVAFKEGFLDGTLGLDRPFYAIHPIALYGFILSLVSLTAWRLRTGILSLAFVAWFVSSMAVVGINRRVPFGLENAHLGHYYCDALVYMLMLTLAAFGNTQHNDALTWHRMRVVPIVSIITVFMAVHLIRAGERWPRTWFVDYEKVADFTTNVRRSIRHASPETLISEGAVPNYVMPGWMAPWNSYSRFASLFPGNHQFVAATKGTAVFDQNGTLGPETHTIQQK